MEMKREGQRWNKRDRKDDGAREIDTAREIEIHREREKDAAGELEMKMDQK